MVLEGFLDFWHGLGRGVCFTHPADLDLLTGSAL